jgi:hypothetical protein
METSDTFCKLQNKMKKHILFIVLVFFGQMVFAQDVMQIEGKLVDIIVTPYGYGDYMDIGNYELVFETAQGKVSINQKTVCGYDNGRTGHYVQTYLVGGTIKQDNSIIFHDRFNPAVIEVGKIYSLKFQKVCFEWAKEYSQLYEVYADNPSSPCGAFTMKTKQNAPTNYLATDENCFFDKNGVVYLLLEKARL